MTTIDFNETQLDDEELREYIANRAADQERSAHQSVERMARARHFRFTGGML